jgi:hypothetical protein
MKTQRGFHVVEVLIAAAVVVVIGFIGYRVWTANQGSKPNTQTSSVPQAPQIKSVKDLDAATSTIDQLNTSSSDLDKLSTDIDSL